MHLLLLGLVACGVLGSSVDGTSNVVVDLSHWNDPVNLKQANADGIVAVIHKATQGRRWVDNKYKERKSEAEKAGLLWGAYHFGIGGVSGASQASHFLSTVGNVDKVLIALDLEWNKAGKNMTLDEANEFVETVKKSTGRYPVLYGGPAFLSSYRSQSLSRCPLWLSHYTTRAQPNIPAGWSSWTLWQYTDGRIGGTPRSVKGIGQCDRNRYSGSVEELKKNWPL